MSRSFDPLPDFDESRPPRQGILLESGILASIGCLDLVTTMYLLHTGQAREANPLMANILHGYGGNTLVLAKAILIGGPIAIAEWARRTHPDFVRRMLWIGIGGYLALYSASFLRLNGG